MEGARIMNPNLPYLALMLIATMSACSIVALGTESTFWNAVDLVETGVKMNTPPSTQTTLGFAIVDFYKIFLEHPAAILAYANARNAALKETLGPKELMIYDSFGTGLYPVVEDQEQYDKSFNTNFEKYINDISKDPNEYDSFVKDLREIPVGIGVGYVVDESLGKMATPAISEGISAFGTALVNNEIEQSQSASSSTSTNNQLIENGQKNDLAGINFTSIKLNSISITTDSSVGVDFDLILKAEKAEGSNPGINIQNATRTGAAAFMTGLAVNDNKFWVNLNPWEVDRIIDEELGQSEAGRIMLEADLQMKRDFSNYGNPCANEMGKALWNLLDKKREDLVQRCMNKFPGEIKETSNIILKPVQRHWIVPDKAYAYSNGSLIYIINASLTINSEPVMYHASFQVKNQDISTLSRGCIEELNRSAQEYAEYYKNLEERMIQPYVVADINTDEKYEDLREVYAALALAQWYKSKVTPHTDIFRDSLNSSSSAILKSQTPWHPKDIWDKYVYSFKNGEYKCWENTTTKTAKGTRTKISLHSAGGVEFKDIRDHLVKIEAMPLEVQDQAKKAITDGIVDSRKEVLFGYRLHVDQKKETQITGTSIRSMDSSQGINDPLKENRTVNEASLTGKKEQIQSSEMPSVGKAGGNTSRFTCPEGWMGPDESGECWQMQIMS